MNRSAGRATLVILASFFFLARSVSVGAIPARATEYAQAAPQNAQFGVYQVRNEDVPPETNTSCVAQREDEIWVDTWGVDEWIKQVSTSPDTKGRAPANPSIRDLVPVLNGVILPGVHPNNCDFEKGHLRFRLSRINTDDSKAAWARLLREPTLAPKEMGFTVGFEQGATMPTWVVKGNPEKKGQFALVTLPKLRLLLGLVLILGALWNFFMLARNTDIVRDTTAPLRPDGRRPYSLGRSQMAFWFFFVIASYFFLWILTGDTDTLNESILGLIGISAGTALSAALVDNSKIGSLDMTKNLPAVDLHQTREKIVADLSALLKQKKDALNALQAARPALNEPGTIELNEKERVSLRQQIDAIESQIGYFQWPPWKGVMHDLLSDDNLISFHRFQIFIWTLVLGVIFVFSVYSDLRMPEFSATLLGLMGISAGTYVGFKFPENAKVAMKSPPE